MIESPVPPNGAFIYTENPIYHFPPLARYLQNPVYANR